MHLKVIPLLQFHRLYHKLGWDSWLFAVQDIDKLRKPPQLAQLLECLHVDREVASSCPALVQFSLFNQKITQSIPLVAFT